jgi:hypothetical protein
VRRGRHRLDRAGARAHGGRPHGHGRRKGPVRRRAGRSRAVGAPRGRERPLYVKLAAFRARYGDRGMESSSSRPSRPRRIPA